MSEVSLMDTLRDDCLFESTTTVTIGKSVYIIERHFIGERDIREAVYTVVKNEAFSAIIVQTEV